tara:strand:- start:386 stop:814 length:429 start_codon:yes stop_codon:yes gene_type:complete
MRATISFEADVSKVNNIMRCLIAEEANTLHDALICLEKATDNRLSNAISEALMHIHAASTQLHQYRSMVASFEEARFNTVLPQNADYPAVNVSAPSQEATVIDSPRSLQNVMQTMEAFNGFVDKMSSSEQKEKDNENEPEEG